MKDLDLEKDKSFKESTDCIKVLKILLDMDIKFLKRSFFWDNKKFEVFINKYENLVKDKGQFIIKGKYYYCKYMYKINVNLKKSEEMNCTNMNIDYVKRRCKKIYLKYLNTGKLE